MIGTVTIYLGRRLPAASCGQPESLGRASLSTLLFGLAPRRVSRPSAHTEAGGLLPHHFTLTPIAQGGMFLCHFPSGHPAWDYPARCPVELGPSSPRQKRGAVTQPAGPMASIACLQGLLSGPSVVRL